MKRGLGWSLNMTEETQDPFRIKEGGVRLLTTGEIQLAHSVFLSTIDYSKVWIHRESYLPFNLQDKNTAMTGRSIFVSNIAMIFPR
jgi:hypothetical protein